MTDRRPTAGFNWNAREPIGRREPRWPLRAYASRVLERLEDELREMEAEKNRPEETGRK